MGEPELKRNLGAFALAIGRAWLSLMSGVVGVAAWAVGAEADNLAAKILFRLCGAVAFFLAGQCMVGNDGRYNWQPGVEQGRAIALPATGPRAKNKAGGP